MFFVVVVIVEPLIILKSSIFNPTNSEGFRLCSVLHSQNQNALLSLHMISTLRFAVLHLKNDTCIHTYIDTFLLTLAHTFDHTVYIPSSLQHSCSVWPLVIHSHCHILCAGVEGAWCPAGRMQTSSPGEDCSWSHCTGQTGHCWCCHWSREMFVLILVWMR